LEAGASRGDLTEAEWRILKDLLPIERKNRRRGRPPEQYRSIINGILWRLRCGAPWRDVPPKYGSWNTIYRRFRQWSETGVWEIVAVTLAEIMADTALIVLPERTPEALLGDKAYDADAIRADLAKRNIDPVMPGRSIRGVKIEHDRALYKQRNRIEHMFGHLKVNRAIATRYGQLASSFLGTVDLATARYWLKFVHAA
jgi:transposase